MNISNVESVSNPVSANAVLSVYKAKYANLHERMVESRSQQSRALAFLVGSVFFLIVLVSVAAAKLQIALVFSAIPLIGIALAFHRYEKFKGVSLEQAHRSDFYERGIDRLTNKWHGNGVSGLEFSRDKHLYQFDLDILGEGSLFELLCTTRSEIGAEHLASYLLDSVELGEARSRQSAVKELTRTLSLREQIALLGKYKFQDCDRNQLNDWLDMPTLRSHPAIAMFLLASSSICAALGIIGLTTLISWSILTPFLLPLTILQITIVAVLSHRVRPQLKMLETLTNEFVVLRQGLDLMQCQQFHSPKLQSLVQRVQGQDASLQLRKLETLLSRVRQRKIECVYAWTLLIALGTQLVLAVERWRTKHRENLKMWLDCWGEFEALNALACYAYEHPANEFPELVEGFTAFNTPTLGHPLLADDACIHNDVLLNETSRFYLISGSNMAGKSTLLRAIGMNAVLASAGAPIRAVNARMSIFTVCASISITDSILEGKSKFLTEVERLKETVGAMCGSKPVLFLIDEILSGTNSKDRRIIVESIMETLVAGGAVGALSTHDLALCEIADVPDLHGVNLHMESENPDDPLDFDYRVKAGTCQRSNALAIVRMLDIGISPDRHQLLHRLPVRRNS